MSLENEKFPVGRVRRSVSPSSVVPNAAQPIQYPIGRARHRSVSPTPNAVVNTVPNAVASGAPNIVANTVPNEAPNSFEKPKVYVYFGHGGDFCDPVTKQIATAIVPKARTLVTLEQCGISLSADIRRETAYFTKDPREIALFEQPFSDNARYKLSNLLLISSDDVHVHTPGMSYAVNLFSPCASFNNANRISMQMSGVCDLEKLRQYQEPYWAQYDFRTDSPSKMRYIDKKYRDNKFYAPQENLRVKSTQKILGQFTFEEVEYIKRFRFREEGQIELFDYLFADLLQHKYWRIKDYNAYKQLSYKEQDKVIFTEDEMNTLCAYTKFFYGFTLEKLGKFYEASVYPTSQQVVDYIGMAYGAGERSKYYFFKGNITPKLFNELPKIINEVIEFHYCYPNKCVTPSVDSYLSTKTILEKFPGIHYFHACRNATSPYCSDSITMRRSVSLENQARARTPPTRKNRKNRRNQMGGRNRRNRKQTNRKRKI